MKYFDRREWMLAVGVAVLVGYADAIGFLRSGGFFVSFMSGNSTQLAIEVSKSSSRAWYAAAVIGVFVVGVVIGSLAGHFARDYRRPAVLGLVAIVLAAAAAFAASGRTDIAVPALALAMGAINAVFEKAGGANTGSKDVRISIGSIRSAPVQRQRKRWAPPVRNVVLWTAVVMGAVVGATVEIHFSTVGIWIASGVSAAFALAARKGQSQQKAS